MRLVVDTNVLVGGLLGPKIRHLVDDPRLELFLPEHMLTETRVEIARRVEGVSRSRGLSADGARLLSEALLASVRRSVLIVDRAVYAAGEEEARARSLRDPDDWPLVACALAVGGAIWTHDNDLLGTGVATWTTPTLQGWLDRHPADDT